MGFSISNYLSIPFSINLFFNKIAILYRFGFYFVFCDFFIMFWCLVLCFCFVTMFCFLSFCCGVLFVCGRFKRQNILDHKMIGLWLLVCYRIRFISILVTIVLSNL